jgi:hypothetical protein
VNGEPYICGLAEAIFVSPIVARSVVVDCSQDSYALSRDDLCVDALSVLLRFVTGAQFALPPDRRGKLVSMARALGNCELELLLIALDFDVETAAALMPSGVWTLADAQRLCALQFDKFSLAQVRLFSVETLGILLYSFKSSSSSIG